MKEARASLRHAECNVAHDHLTVILRATSHTVRRTFGASVASVLKICKGRVLGTPTVTVKTILARRRCAGSLLTRRVRTLPRYERPSEPARLNGVTKSKPP
jgi:hypothetical protein